LNYIGAPGKPGLRRLASWAAPADGFRITAAPPCADAESNSSAGIERRYQSRELSGAVQVTRPPS